MVVLPDPVGPVTSSSPCGAEVLTVQPPQPTTLSSTQVWGNSLRGASITVPGSATGEHDEAQLSGANAASSSGAFTFNLYRQAAEGPQCTGTPVFTSTVPFAPDQNGGASSKPVPTALQPAVTQPSPAPAPVAAAFPTTALAPAPR